MSEREIVSLRSTDGSCMIFGELISESANTWFIRDAGQNCAYHREFGKKAWTIRRNLAAMPHEWFGRELAGGDKGGWYIGEQTCGHKHFGHSGVGCLFMDEPVFLDDTPDIKITVEINGETSSLSDISEETLLNIRNKSK